MPVVLRPLQRRLLLTLLFVTAAVAVLLPSQASHFRGGSLGWSAVDGDTVQAEGQFLLRHSAWPTVVTGDIVCTLSYTLFWGDGAKENLCVRVTSIHADDSFAGTIVNGTGGPVTHTYASQGPWTMSVDTCCWFGSFQGIVHHNNPDAMVRYTSVVDLGAGGSPPLALYQAAFLCAASANCTLDLSTTDPDGDAVSYALATTEAGSSFRQPTGASIDPTTGIFTWPAPAKPTPGAHDYWSVAVVASDGRSRTISEFLVGPDVPSCGLGGPVVSQLSATVQPKAVELAWSAPRACAPTEYLVQRDGGQGFATVAVVQAPAHSYTDPVGQCFDFAYRVLARAPGAAAVDGARAYASDSRGKVPTAPTNLVATLQTQPFAHVLDWDPSRANPCDVTDYAITRVDANNQAHSFSVPANTTAFTDASAQPCTAYTYTIVANNAVGPSAAASVAVSPPPTPPARPGFLSVTTQGHGTRQVWSPGAGACAATSYEVLRDGVVIATHAASGGSQVGVDPGPLESCRTYVYEVRGVNAAGPGPALAFTYRHPIVVTGVVNGSASCPTLPG